MYLSAIFFIPTIPQNLTTCILRSIVIDFPLQYNYLSIDSTNLVTFTACRLSNLHKHKQAKTSKLTHASQVCICINNQARGDTPLSRSYIL